jgi:putative GTP pyrophosphokinase
MAFAPVPSESKNQIRTAGDILISDAPSSSDLKWAQDLANRWRACHLHPINTFQATLRNKIKRLGKRAIVAQRLKRMPTIIDKLRIYRTMNLTTMQDIGGVRAIVRTVSDVRKLVDEYQEGARLSHELTRFDDYIDAPRDADGYRSVHMVYAYRNKRSPGYDGLRIELQIRTQLQHIWATAVESMGTFLGQALKSRRGDQEWLDFFALVSAAFAYQEGCPLIPRAAGLSQAEVAEAISRSESALNALSIMDGLTAATRAIDKHLAKKQCAYHLISLDSSSSTVKISPYGRDGYDRAMADYAKLEQQAADGALIEVVLVSAGTLRTLQKAYPNFFLDVRGFVRIVTDIVQSVRN